MKDDSTIFDDVLRTIQERLPKLLILLVNEVFDTSYSEDAEVARLPEEKMNIEFADGQMVTYTVPVLKLNSYSIDEIFEKNLLILLPYYIINYEKELSEIALDVQKTKQLMAEYT